jgi:hypothetical protein
MTLERCIIRAGGPTKDCSFCQGKQFILSDRTGEQFPVMREWQHRNVIYNCKHTYMADRADSLEKMGLGKHEGSPCGHFIFTDESAARVDQIIFAYEQGYTPIDADIQGIRRIK